MKPIGSFCTIAFCLVLCGSAFTGCSKNNGNSASSGAVFTATVNGKDFVPTVAGGDDVTSGNFFYIAGNQVSAADTIILSISMPDNPALNMAIPFDGSNTVMAYEDIKTGTVFSNNGMSSPPGSITVTSLSPPTNQIAGTFSGTLYSQSNASDSMVVTNGKFDVSYTIQ